MENEKWRLFSYGLSWLTIFDSHNFVIPLVNSHDYFLTNFPMYILNYWLVSSYIESILKLQGLAYRDNGNWNFAARRKVSRKIEWKFHEQYDERFCPFPWFYYVSNMYPLVRISVEFSISRKKCLFWQIARNLCSSWWLYVSSAFYIEIIWCFGLKLC